MASGSATNPPRRGTRALSPPKPGQPLNAAQQAQWERTWRRDDDRDLAGVVPPTRFFWEWRGLQDDRKPGVGPTLLQHLFAWWARWPLEVTGGAAIALAEYGRSFERFDGACRADIAAGRQNFGDQLVHAHHAAVRHLDPIVAAGLAAREGRFIVPPMVFRMDLLDDKSAWQMIEMLLRTLKGNARTQPLRVCVGCTLVFRPRREDAVSCDLCRHHRPAPAHYLGRAGAARVPVFEAEGSRFVKSWRTVTFKSARRRARKTRTRAAGTSFGAPATAGTARRRAVGAPGGKPQRISYIAARDRSRTRRST